MKILSITLENINSLKGAFTIPLEDYIADNALVFAITGPTGSGKTSILDAICAALYGKTPRLKQTSAMAELMTHHTGRCMAEVSFSINNKIYRSRYERHRAYNKPDGKLRNATMELVDGKTGKIIAEKPSTVPKAVEKITGLDFNRFCKSILLAQGNFDAFLKADRDDRAQLLEKITGTQIYSQISTKTFEKNKEEKEKLTQIRDHLALVHLLSSDETQEIQTQLKENDLQLSQIIQTQKTMIAAKAYFKNLEDCQLTRQQCEKDLAELEKQEQAAAPELAILKQARNTTPFLEDYQQLKQADVTYKALVKTQEELNKAIPVIEEALKTAQNNQSIADTELSKSKKIANTKQTIIASIKTQLPLLKDRIETNHFLSHQLEEKKNNSALLEKQKLSVQKQLADKTQSLSVLEDRLKTLKQNKKELEQKKQGLLAGRSMDSLENERLVHADEYQLFNDIKECLADVDHLEKEKVDLTSEKIEITSILKRNKVEQTSVQTKIQDLKTSLENLKCQRELEIKIQNLEVLRNELVENEPCPLCGSTDHPWQTNRPQKTQIALKIEKEEQRLEIETQRRESLQKNAIVSSSRLSHLTERHEQTERSFDAKKQQLKNLSRKKNQTYTLKTIEPILRDAKRCAKALSDLIADLNKIQSKLQTTDKTIHDQQEARHIMSQSVQQVVIDHDRVLLQVDQNKKDTFELSGQLKKNEEHIQKISQTSKGFDQISILPVASDILNPVALEKELDALSGMLEAGIIKHNQAMEIAVNQLHDTQIKQSEKKKALDQCLGDIQKQTLIKDGLHRQFEIKLSKKGFNNHIHFKSFLLDDSSLAAYEALEKKLSHRRIQLKTLQQTNEKRLNVLLDQPPVQTDLDDIKSASKTADNALAKANKTKAALEFRLQENERLNAQHKDLLNKETAQTRECSKWSLLNELIGQKDGAKFRLFAQNLTLERLIYQANLYLKLFNNRYILEKNADLELDIMVIDTFFADKIRPMENLSGGETFLISLSLALGLSDITSRQTNIESLFLDEGFGTLDKDTLEVALSAIDTLNASGKTVCIISHVETLKERIYLKVEVTPVSDGTSRVSLSA